MPDENAAVALEPEPVVPVRKLAKTRTELIREELSKGAAANLHQFADKDCRICNGKGSARYLVGDDRKRVVKVCDCIIRQLNVKPWWRR